MPPARRRRGDRRRRGPYACTGSAADLTSPVRTTTTGQRAACRQSRATGPSGVRDRDAGVAGPAGPAPPGAAQHEHLRPDGTLDQDARRRPVGQFHLDACRLRAEGLPHHRLQGG